MRTPIMAGNWKMNKTNSEAVKLVKELKQIVKDVNYTEIIVCPAFTALSDVAKELKGSSIKLGAQNLYSEDSGAFTGETSPLMLKEICSHVIIGHSERRQYFNETNEDVNKKIKKALEHGLVPIVCVGETLEQRETNKTKGIIDEQISQGLEGLSESQMSKLVIAYEPVWAIGTGKTATPKQAEEVHKFIRSLIEENFSKQIAEKTKILYGGSVKPDNIKELMKEKDIDGALVGGASLKAEDFSKIVKFKE